MAVGKCFGLHHTALHHRCLGQRVPVVAAGRRLAFDDAVVRKALTTEVVDIEVALGVGRQATAYGCDLTRGTWTRTRRLQFIDGRREMSDGRTLSIATEKGAVGGCSTRLTIRYLFTCWRMGRGRGCGILHADHR